MTLPAQSDSALQLYASLLGESVAVETTSGMVYRGKLVGIATSPTLILHDDSGRRIPAVATSVVEAIQRTGEP